MSDTNISNCPHYDAAMNEARLLGGNFRLIRQRKRTLALELIRAAHIENFALEPMISDAKAKMGFAKLDSAEKNQANVFFSTVRTISGAWPGLDDEKRKAFLDGSLIFSTLAKEIKEAEKAKAEAEATAEAEAEAAEAARNEPVDPETGRAPVEDRSESILSVAAMLEGDMTEGEMEAMNALFEAVDAYRAARSEALATGTNG